MAPASASISRRSPLTSTCWNWPSAFFSADDLAIFEAYPAREKVAAFYRAWTRKEAYLKARGEGIAEGLQEISVSMAPEEVLSIKDSRNVSAAEKWHLVSLPLPAATRARWLVTMWPGIWKEVL